MFRRRREKKTDYRARLALVKSGKPRLVVRRSLNNIHIQLIAYGKTSDKTLFTVLSKHLKKYGWQYHGGSLPSSYLTGFLAGKIALSKGIKESFVDIGLQTSTKGSCLFVAALGAKNAGLNVPVGSEILPSEDRISGKHIAKYAAELKQNDSKKYAVQFSSCLKNKNEPEKLPEKFAEVRNKIVAEFGNGSESKEANPKENDEWEDVQ